jgi:protein involved in polysaccharide export with SLBB domain
MQPPVPLLTRPGANKITADPGQEQIDSQRDLRQQPGLLQPAPTATPEPDTEYQEFAASSLGMSLPIFGENLFAKVPSTFAPLDRVQVTPDYIVGAGDELIIRLWGQINQEFRRVVDRSGTIYIPSVGVINVAGVRYQDLPNYLETEVGRIFKDFRLSVTLGSLRAIEIFVVGRA